MAICCGTRLTRCISTRDCRAFHNTRHSEWRDARAAYGIDFAERRSMDPALMSTAIEQGQVDLISAFSSDGRVLGKLADRSVRYVALRCAGFNNLDSGVLERECNALFEGLREGELRRCSRQG